MSKSGSLARGLGGWLIAVQLILWLSLAGTLLHVLFDLLPLIGSDRRLQLTSPGSPGYDAMWQPVLWLEACGNSIVMVWLAAAALCLYKQKRAFVPLMIGYLALVLLFSIIVYGFMLAGSGVLAERAPISGQKIMQNALLCLVFIPYLLKSARVKHTFIH